MNVCIIGAGLVGKHALSCLKELYDRILFYDNDRRKWNSNINGVEVITLDQLLDLINDTSFDFIIASNAKSILYFIKDINLDFRRAYFFDDNTEQLSHIDANTILGDGFEYDIEELEKKKLNHYQEAASYYKSNNNELLYSRAMEYIDFKTHNILCPEITGIELTNNCNLNCPNCPVPYLQREKGFMNDETFELSMKYVPPRNQSHFIIHGFGEPLLHPKLIEYLQKMVDLDIKLVMSTNAVLLDAKKMVEIFNVLRTAREPLIYISFHTKKSVEKWKECVEYIISNNINNITLYGQVLEHNLAEAEKWLKEVGETNPRGNQYIRYITSHSFGGHVHGRKVEYESIEVYNRIRNCHHVRNNLASIAWDGTIRMCCMDCNADSGCGNVYSMETVRTNPHGYKWCKNCDPDWETNYQ